MTEFYLNFNHSKLKNEMMELLNQFEYVDKSYKDDVSFAKPEHSRQLRKIYNRMNDILENQYKNIPKELETYNKNTPKEEKPKKTPKTTKTPKTPKTTKTTLKQPKIPIKGGNNNENSPNNIFQKTTQKITFEDNNDTINDLFDDGESKNVNDEIIKKVHKMNKLLISSYDPDKKYTKESANILISKINVLVDLIDKNYLENIDEIYYIKKNWKNMKINIINKHNL